MPFRMTRAGPLLATLIGLAVAAAIGSPVLRAPGDGLIAARASERAPTCASEIGRAAARRLADRCLRASPATHPPCNPANPCAMIRDEIRRSCRLFERTSPLPAELCAQDTTR